MGHPFVLVGAYYTAPAASRQDRRPGTRGRAGRSPRSQPEGRVGQADVELQVDVAVALQKLALRAAARRLTLPGPPTDEPHVQDDDGPLEPLDAILHPQRQLEEESDIL